MMHGVCFHCQKKCEIEKASFRQECPHCFSDLHICLNCHFYDAHSYNECKEPSAEKVIDKKKNNRCEYFKPLIKEMATVKDKASLREVAEKLFKK